jgi:hypothetical protein
VPILFIFFYLGLVFSMGLYFYLRSVANVAATRYRNIIEIFYICYCIVATLLLSTYAFLFYSQKSFGSFINYNLSSFLNLVGYNAFYLFKASLLLSVGYFIYYLISRKVPERYKKAAIVASLMVPTVAVVVCMIVLFGVLFSSSPHPSTKDFLLSPRLFFI